MEAGISATNKTCSGLLPPSPSLASSIDENRFQFHPEVSSFLGPAQQALPCPSLLHLLPKTWDQTAAAAVAAVAFLKDFICLETSDASSFSFPIG